MQAVKTVKIQDIRAQVAEAALTNELRSGERGKVAQKRLLDLEAKCATPERPLTVFRNGIPEFKFLRSRCASALLGGHLGSSRQRQLLFNSSLLYKTNYLHYLKTIILI